jgi:hypothetical protein
MFAIINVKEKINIPASDVVLQTCDSSPMVPVKAILSQKSVKWHLMQYSLTIKIVMKRITSTNRT